MKYWKKKALISLMAIIAVNGTFLLAGCSQGETVNPSDTQEQVYSFTDDLGQELTIQKPQRVASMIGSYSDIWVQAGGKESLVAAAHDTWTSFDLDLDESVVDLGEIKNPNTELLLSSNCDLVLASAKNESNREMKELLDTLGIPVAYFDVSSFDDYLRMLKICTMLTGDEEAYETYGTSLQEEIDSYKEMAASKNPSTVLYVRATGSGVKAKSSEGSVLGEMLADLNTVNIADGSDLLENLSMEAIMEADPEYIFLVYQGSDDSKARAVMEESLLSNPAWQTLQAVKNNHVYVMDQTLYNLKPNARWAQAYKGVFEILYGQT